MDSEQKQSEDDPENPRIECKSKRSVNVLLETLKEETMKLRNSINFSVKNDLEPLHRNLFQVYKRAFLSNILVDGQIIDNTDDEDTTSEFEPLDTEKEKFFQHELMNRFDEQLVTTTQLRKTGPHLVRSHMKKMIRPELKHLALVQVVADSTNTDLVEIDVREELLREDIEARLQNTAPTLETVKQDCEEMIVKSKDLLQALKQYNKTEHSNIQQVMFETPPSTPVATSGNKNTSIKCEISKKLLL